jgi:hypothetical protein
LVLLGTSLEASFETHNFTLKLKILFSTLNKIIKIAEGFKAFLNHFGSFLEETINNNFAPDCYGAS